MSRLTRMTYPLGGPGPGHEVTDIDQVKEGAQVWVQSFGRWRDGEVTKVGRTRVTVRCIRNDQGTEHEAAQPLGAVRLQLL
jgi:hypothetical protein